MADRLALGPVQVFGTDLHALNDAFRQLSERIDALKGLRGRAEVFDRLRVDDPEAADEALTQGAADLEGFLPLTGGTLTGTVNGTLFTGTTSPTAASHLTRKDYVDGSGTLDAEGSHRLPNGLILNWGDIPSTASGADATVTFVAAFSTECFQVWTTVNGTAEGAFAVNGTPTTTAATLRNTSAGTLTGRYLAVGV